MQQWVLVLVLLEFEHMNEVSITCRLTIAAWIDQSMSVSESNSKAKFLPLCIASCLERE